MQINQAIDWQGKMLGRYRLVRLLGNGGMGEVWQAEDTELHRQVALKMLPSVVANETAYLRAFADEARTIASLEHPHILPVHDFGEEVFGEDVVTYLIMPLIAGGSLRERIREAQGLLTPKAGLDYLFQAAQAIDYAHSQHVLHRDIKPANMLMQQQWLFLADFGLAKLLSTDAHHSQTHAGAGTPDYMAPEQAQDKAEAASDRYSLAVIAYQLFSGHKPFSSSDPYEVLIKQMQEQPPSPRQFNPQLPQAVEDTLLKGLAKQPSERPASCIEFVTALEHGWQGSSFFQQKPTIHPLPQQEEDAEATILAPWSKRHIANQETQRVSPPATSRIANNDRAIVPKDAAGAKLSHPSPPLSIEDEARDTTNPEHTSEQSQKIGRRGLLIGGVTAAAVVAAGGATYLHFRSASPEPRAIPGPHKLIMGIPLLRLTGHTDAVWNVVWHPSGRYIATAGADTHMMLWDVESSLQKNPKTIQVMKQPLQQWKFDNNINSNMISWSADGRTLAVLPLIVVSLTTSSFINIITDRQKTPTLYSNKNVSNFDEPIYNCLAWSPVDNLLAVSFYLSTDIELWKRGKADAPQRTLKGTPVPPALSAKGPVSVEEMGWSYDGTLLAGTRDDFTVTIWAIKTGKVLQTLSLPDRSSDIPPRMSKDQVIGTRRYAIEWSPKVRNNLVVSDLDIATVWNAVTNKSLLTLTTDDPIAFSNTVSSDGLQLIPQINGLTWSPNGRYIAGSYEHSHQIYIWDTLNKTPRKTKEGFHIDDLRFGQTDGHANTTGSTIIDLAWSPDGRYLATASNDTTVIIWRVDGA